MDMIQKFINLMSCFTFNIRFTNIYKYFQYLFKLLFINISKNDII